jgi:DNA polymerase
MTVHDELVIEAPVGFGGVEEVERLMGEPIDWAEGLPLKGAGFESFYYRKD